MQFLQYNNSVLKSVRPHTIANCCCVSLFIALEKVVFHAGNMKMTATIQIEALLANSEKGNQRVGAWHLQQSKVTSRINFYNNVGLKAIWFSISRQTRLYWIASPYLSLPEVSRSAVILSCLLNYPIWFWKLAFIRILSRFPEFYCLGERNDIDDNLSIKIINAWSNDTVTWIFLYSDDRA